MQLVGEKSLEYYQKHYEDHQQHQDSTVSPRGVETMCWDFSDCESNQQQDCCYEHGNHDEEDYES